MLRYHSESNMKALNIIQEMETEVRKIFESDAYSYAEKRKHLLNLIDSEIKSRKAIFLRVS